MSNISDLRFDDKNMNAHTAKGMGLLEKSLQQFGAGRSILIDKNNRIIGGNGVVEAAGNIGLEDVQIVESDGKKIIAVKRTDIDLDSKEGRELAMADNAVAAEDLSWDKGNIEEVSEQFGIDPGDWISDWDAQAEQEIVEDEAPEVDESEPAKSELGKVYQLGEHRLMCGDSTDAGSVAILMDGQKADMVFTDPPYNVGMSRSLVSGKDNSIMNDNLADEDFAVLLEKSIQNMADFSNKKSIYLWIGFRAYSIAEKILKKYYKINNCIVWVKPSIGLGGKGYRYQHELCIFSGEVKNKSLSDVWECGRDKQGLHPTMKPVELVAKAINDSSENGESVVDLFGGSGSTLIACEQLGRKCYMMELDPKYCDVIRKRYWKLTHDGNEEGWEEGTLAI
jgi:DNA modification methylase